MANALSQDAEGQAKVLKVLVTCHLEPHTQFDPILFLSLERQESLLQG